MYIDNGALAWSVLQAYAANCGWTRFCASRADASACDAVSDNHGFDSPFLISDFRFQIADCENIQSAICNLQSAIWCCLAAAARIDECDPLSYSTGVNRTTNAK
jgi:hypothetical protein